MHQIGDILVVEEDRKEAYIHHEEDGQDRPPDKIDSSYVLSKLCLVINVGKRN